MELTNYMTNGYVTSLNTAQFSLSGNQYYKCRMNSFARNYSNGIPNRTFFLPSRDRQLFRLHRHLQGALRLERGPLAGHTAAAVLVVVRPANGTGAYRGRVHAIPGGPTQFGEIATLTARSVRGDIPDAIAGPAGGRSAGGAQQATGERNAELECKICNINSIIFPSRRFAALSAATKCSNAISTC